MNKLSAIGTYLAVHGNRLDPEKRRALEQLPANVVEQLHALIFVDDAWPDDEDEELAHALRLERMRRHVPALDELDLSDDEVDLALDVAKELSWKA